MLLKNALKINPIIVKELRSRMRGTRPFITITIMLLVLAGITFGVYRVVITSFNSYSGSPISPQLGQMLFVMLSFLLLIVICILTPAVTAGSITTEREQLTYEMLLSTPLHPAKIIWGKLFSSLSYIFLLIFSAIPIASLIFVFGGVTLKEMIKSFIILIAVTITLGVVGVFISSLIKRTSRATVVSYVLIVIIIFGSILFYVVAGILQQGIPARWIIAINPISALASALSNSTAQYNSILGFIPILGVDLNMLGGDTISFNSIPRPLYHFSLPLYGFIALILYFLSVRLITPTRRWKISRKDLLIFLSAIFLLCAIVLGLFFATTDSYEKAINTANQNSSRPFGAMVEPAIPRVLTAPAIKVSENAELESSLGLTIEEQANIYSLAIFDSVHEFEESRQIIAETIYIVQQVMETEDNEIYQFILPAPLQIAITEKFNGRLENIVWVERIEDVFENPNINPLPTDFVINIGNLQPKQEDMITVYVTININGSVETQTNYIFKSLDNEWKIETSEKIFDVTEVN